MSKSRPDAIGAYRILAVLGRGGTGFVYRGDKDGTHYAIKCLHDFVRDEPELRARFVREGRLTASLRHPNLVHVFELAEDPHVGPYLVMEELRGVSLAQVLGAKVPVPIAVAGRLIRGLLAALTALHEVSAGRIVHGDVSPQNVVVGFDGSVKLIDLGLARADHATRVTRSAALRGKLRYLAPEQLEAAPQPTAASDAYAAAVVAWETLTGEALVSGKDNRVRIARILAGQHPAPSARRSDVPATLDAVVVRGLSRRPEERWESTRAFGAAFEHAGPLATDAEVGAWLRQTLPTAAAEALDTELQPRPEPRRARYALLVVPLVLALAVAVWPRTVPRSIPTRIAAARAPAPVLPALDPPAATAGSVSPRPSAIVAPKRVPHAASSCVPAFSFDPMGNKTYRPGCL